MNQDVAQQHGKPQPLPIADVEEQQMVNVKVQVTIGDITQATTDGIVNSTNSSFNLSSGRVSRAIVEAGGPSFVDECKKHGSIRPNSSVVTGSGNMRCNNVIHVDVTSKQLTWTDIIKGCLQTAEEAKMRSLTFPALGTGTYGGDTATMAKNLMDAVADFAKTEPAYLTTIRVVLYDSGLFQEYIAKMEEAHINL